MDAVEHLPNACSTKEKKKKICCVWRSFLTTTVSKEQAADQSGPEEREIRKEMGNLKGYAFEALEKSLPDHLQQPKKRGCILKKNHFGSYVKLLK